MQIASTEGFGPRKDGEDQFDTAIGLLDMILEGGVEQISFFGRVVELCAMVDSHSVTVRIIATSYPTLLARTAATGSPFSAAA